MTTCLEFRRRVGAEPFADDAEIDAHRRGCAACARYQDELRAMDRVIQRALAIDPSPRERAATAPAAAPGRRGLFAIAASLVAGAAVSLLLLVGVPRESVARAVIGHVVHEPGAMAATAPMPVAEVGKVLEPHGLRLRAGAGEVTYATNCPLDGHIVPHLVVRTAGGPVTVLMLKHREIAKRMRFDEQGYQGVVLPAPKGSIAIVGQDVSDLDGVAQRVFDAVDWNG